MFRLPKERRTSALYQRGRKFAKKGENVGGGEVECHSRKRIERVQEVHRGASVSAVCIHFGGKEISLEKKGWRN